MLHDRTLVARRAPLAWQQPSRWCTWHQTHSNMGGGACQKLLVFHGVSDFTHVSSGFHKYVSIISMFTVKVRKTSKELVQGPLKLRSCYYTTQRGQSLEEASCHTVGFSATVCPTLLRFLGMFWDSLSESYGPKRKEKMPCWVSGPSLGRSVSAKAHSLPNDLCKFDAR